MIDVLEVNTLDIGWPVLAIAIVAAVALSALLSFTRFGLNARAVIANEPLARGLGIV